jgi:AcrR family transcriptional regulator
LRVSAVKDNTSDNSYPVLALSKPKLAKKIRTNPRKAASQTRSRATVDALLEATARILVKEGYDKASTNRVAEVAGVSIGSLYQYFPNKESLLVALVARHSEDVMAVVRKELVAAYDDPIDRAVEKLVGIAVKAHRVDPKLHRVLSEQVPRVGPLEKMDGFNRDYFDMFKALLERHADVIRVQDLTLASFVCVTSIEALTHNAVLNGRITTDADAQALVGEAGCLLKRYLLG